MSAPTTPAELIPFDLERAKAGEPVIMRSGERLTFIAHVPNARCTTDQVQMLTETGSIHGYRVDGRFFEDGVDSICDAFMAAKREPSDEEILAFYHAASPFSKARGDKPHETVKAIIRYALKHGAAAPTSSPAVAA